MAPADETRALSLAPGVAALIDLVGAKVGGLGVDPGTIPPSLGGYPGKGGYGRRYPNRGMGRAMTTTTIVTRRPARSPASAMTASATSKVSICAPNTARSNAIEPARMVR